MTTTDPIPSRYLPTRLHVVPDAMPTDPITTDSPSKQAQEEPPQS